MPNALRQLYRTSLSLLTDFYQLTMAYGYWKAGIHEREAVFYHCFRQLPFKGGYAICAGLGTLIDYLVDFQFTEEDLSYLAELKTAQGHRQFPDAFLEYLRTLRFSCDLHAIEEGSVVFPQEPLVRIQGPLLQCQLLESILLNIINFQTLIATNAARVVQATQNEPVLEFGLRRAQGFDGALMASRAAHIGGCSATSNVLAGKLFNIPIRGTQAHSWILCFDSEREAFREYAKTFPDQTVFLVDTFNTRQGVKHAIEVADELKENGFRLAGVRLDSGDLAYLSEQARRQLDEAGYCDAQIIASNNLTPQVITSLKEQKASIDSWGVGTHLITAFEQPALDGVYKLSAMRSAQGDWQYKVKLSEQTLKISTPGILAARRFYLDESCQFAMADMIYDQNTGVPEECIIIDPVDPTRRCPIPKGTPYQELMQPIFKKGQFIYKRPTLQEARKKTHQHLQHFHESIRRLLNPHLYPVGLVEELYHHKLKIILKEKGLLKESL